MIHNFESTTIQSHNAILNMVLSGRDLGKTWSLKRRAVRRALKHGKKTLWLRRFQPQSKETAMKFFRSRDLLKFCGLQWYDRETKTGNLKQQGRTFYIKRKNGKWIDFIQIAAVSEHADIRSCDDVDCDTIVYDEFTAKPQEYRRYTGDEVSDFMDIFHSIERDHEVRVFMLGNKESINNPYFQYFGIKPMPTSWEGIRTYRDGSIAYQQINNVPDQNTDYYKKKASLLEGTRYGDYLLHSGYKGMNSKMKFVRMPSNASVYIQLCWNGLPLKIATHNGFFYVNQRVDTSKRVFCDQPVHTYPREKILVTRQKSLFTALINAVADNRVHYDDASTYEAIQGFYDWLNIN